MPKISTSLGNPTALNSSPSLPQPGSVVITSFEELSSLFSELKTRPEMAGQIRAFEYNDNGEEEYDDEEADECDLSIEGAVGKEQAIIAAKRAQCNADITYILEQITQRGQLKSFKWDNQYESSEDIEPRAEDFWNALAGAAGTLEHLSLSFVTHELHHLGDLILFPTPFEQLLTLHFDLCGCHGDDASQVHQILHAMPKLTSLSLQMPSCDLENCRLQGITYDYDFPNLRSINIYGWLDLASGLLDFFHRHPSITTLSFSMESDDEDDLTIPATTLPDLRALAVDNIFSTCILSELLSSSSLRKITYLSLKELPHKFLPLLAVVGQSLHCFELRTYRVDEWREDPDELHLKELLPSLPELLEFALDFPTGNTSRTNEAGEWVHPAPVDVEDLRRLLSSFSACTKIRAVRISDERGLPLPSDFLADLSEIAPPSLEYIGWDVDKDKKTLYRLEKTTDGRVEAKECGPVRPIRTFTPADAWTGQSIFEHVN